MSARTGKQRSARDGIARAVDYGLPTLGVAVVLAAVVLGGGGWTSVWMAVVGLLMVEAGAWRLGSRVVHERRYTPLRSEVRRFVGLARDLHHASAAARTDDSPATRRTLEETVAAMRGALDRMIEVAGRTEAEVAAEAAVAAEAREEQVPPPAPALNG